MSKYLWLPGDTTSWVYTPDSAALSITSDIEIICYVQIDGSTGDLTIVNKFGEGVGGYRLRFVNNGQIQWAWGSGSTFNNSSVSFLPTDTPIWVRLTWDENTGGGSYETRYYYSTDPIDTALGSISWTEDTTGAPDTGTSGSLVDTTNTLYIGVRDGTVGSNGRVYRLVIRSGIGGTTELDANFDNVTPADVTAGTFTEESSNAATMTFAGNDWCLVNPRTAGLLGEAELLLLARDAYTEGNPRWADLSGNDHHAQLGSAAGGDTNDPTLLPYDGRQYFRNPGTANNYITTNTNTNTDLDIDVGEVMTVVVWHRYSISSTFDHLVGTDRGLSIEGWNLTHSWSSGRDPRVRFYDGTGSAERAAAVQYADDGEWHMTAFTINHDTTDIAKLFLDGVQSGADLDVSLLGNITQSAVGGSPSTGGLQIACGRADSGVLAGDIAYVGIWKDEASAAQLLAAYNAGVGSAPSLSNPVSIVDFSDKLMLAEPFASFTDPQGNSFTIGRSSTLIPATVVDRAMWVFDGTDDYMEIADDANLDFGAAEDFTLAVVVRPPDVTPAGNQTILAKKLSQNDVDAGYQIYNRLSPNDHYAVQIADGTTGVVESTGVASDLTKAVVVGVRDTSSDDLQAFLDGTGETPTTDPTTATLATANDLRIGRLSSTGTQYYRGEIHAVALWRRALTDAEIEQLGGLLEGGRMPPDHRLDRLRANPAWRPNMGSKARKELGWPVY